MVEKFRAAMPDLPKDEVMTRLHYLFGAFHQIWSHCTLPEGETFEGLLDSFMSFYEAGMRAPAPDGKRAKGVPVVERESQENIFLVPPGSGRYWPVLTSSPVRCCRLGIPVVESWHFPRIPFPRTPLNLLAEGQSTHVRIREDCAGCG